MMMGIGIARVESIGRRIVGQFRLSLHFSLINFYCARCPMVYRRTWIFCSTFHKGDAWDLTPFLVHSKIERTFQMRLGLLVKCQILLLEKSCYQKNPEVQILWLRQMIVIKNSKSLYNIFMRQNEDSIVGRVSVVQIERHRNDPLKGE